MFWEFKNMNILNIIITSFHQLLSFWNWKCCCFSCYFHSKSKRWWISEERIRFHLHLQASKTQEIWLKSESGTSENKSYNIVSNCGIWEGDYLFLLWSEFLWLKAGLSHLLRHLELLNPPLAILLQSWGRRGITALIHCWRYWQELRHSSHWRPWIFTIVIHCGKCFQPVLSLYF